MKASKRGSDIVVAFERELRSTENRLLSIDDDATQVARLLSHWQRGGTLPPVFANLRCGAWYLAPFGDALRPHHSCYFKSADGHYGRWTVAMSRLNVHVIEAIYALDERPARCVVIVDATQHGKKCPDSFSKTIPLWAHAVNIACGVTEIDPQSLYPSWVPHAEVCAMASVAEAAARHLRDSPEWVSRLSALSVRCRKAPLTCCFVAPPAASDREAGNDTARVLHGTFPALFTCRRAATIVLLVASSDLTLRDVTGRRSWHYVPGAGDDHESWSAGLTPQSFFRNREAVRTWCERHTFAMAGQAEAPCASFDELLAHLAASPLPSAHESADASRPFFTLRHPWVKLYSPSKQSTVVVSPCSVHAATRPADVAVTIQCRPAFADVTDDESECTRRQRTAISDFPTMEVRAEGGVVVSDFDDRSTRSLEASLLAVGEVVRDAMKGWPTDFGVQCTCSANAAVLAGMCAGLAVSVMQHFLLGDPDTRAHCGFHDGSAAAAEPPIVWTVQCIDKDSIRKVLRHFSGDETVVARSVGQQLNRLFLSSCFSAASNPSLPR